ncbi:MAG TPA: hypothetical protein VMT38_09800 [Terracidiphilus sp.]|nr:hypothetical protein [Terracidiphilus sp.]
MAPRLSEFIAGVVLFAATACVVLWQNAHVAVFWDTSYVLDSAIRFAHGQMPYRDFPFVHPPLTFLVQAAIIRLTGRVFFHHVVYAAVAGGLATVLTWRIALGMLCGRAATAHTRARRGAWTAESMLALLVAAPLTVLGIYSIVPIPEYDGDCAFCILVALWLMQRAEAKRSVVRGLVAGVALYLPLFTKQNMGLPFLAASVVAVLVALISAAMRRDEDSAAQGDLRALAAILAGVCATLVAALLALHWTAGIRNYFYWTITFAGERRLPALDAMTAVFRDPALMWTLPCVAAALGLLFAARRFRWAQIAAFVLLAAPFVSTIASLVIYDDADSRGDSLLALWPLVLVVSGVAAIVNQVGMRRRPSLRAMFPLIVLAAVAGTFMSQQLWGSTYAIWPLPALLVADLLAVLAPLAARAESRWLVPALAAVICVTLMVCGGFYTASEERLSYVDLPAAPIAHSAFPALEGMSTPGLYLDEFDELLRYAAANIPQNDGLILIPGEDPFYFATGRVPKFPVLLFDPTTDPYSPAETAALARTQNIRWLIVKRDLQIRADPTPNRDATMQTLMGEFTVTAHLRGYDVYHR